MDYSQAVEIAKAWVENLSPYCQRIEIAGSLRRRKPEVKDIEIVAIPIETKMVNMFGQVTAGVGAIDGYLTGAGIHFVKSGDKYKQAILREGIKLDLFLVTPPAQWGYIMAIRTGPADYSKWLVTSRRYGGAMPSYLKGRDGAIWHGTRIVETPDEESFFGVLGIPMLPPELRKVPSRAELLQWLNMAS